jgi:hypothetical protein
VGSNSKFSNIKFMVSETRICMLHENNVRSLAVEIFLKREKMLSGNVLVVAKLFKAAAPKQKSRKQNRKTKRKQVDRWDQNHRLTLWSSTTKTAGNWRISRTQHLLNVTKNLLRITTKHSQKRWAFPCVGILIRIIRKNSISALYYPTKPNILKSDNRYNNRLKNLKS